MKRSFSLIRFSGALTLVELVLALALGAFILVPLTTTLNTALQSWKENNERSEMIQHARLVMRKISREFKYAYEMTDNRPACEALQFSTLYVVDGTPDVENIRYFKAAPYLYYEVVSETASERVAGAEDDGISVAKFTAVPLKHDGLGALVVLDTLDDIGLAVAIELSIELMDSDGDAVAMTSIVAMRNQ